MIYISGYRTGESIKEWQSSESEIIGKIIKNKSIIILF